MFAKNIRKLIKNAKLGRFGNNWKYVGNKAEKELENISIDLGLYCAACGLEIEDGDKFLTDERGDSFHERCFGRPDDE